MKCKFLFPNRGSVLRKTSKYSNFFKLYKLRSHRKLHPLKIISSHPSPELLSLAQTIRKSAISAGL